MVTCLLTDKEVRLDNVPDLADITTMAHLLVQHGAEVTTKLNSQQRSVILNGAGVNDTTAPYDLVRKMRASVLVLGPLVARTARRAFRCPAVVPSARARSYSTSRACSSSAPRSS